MTTRLGMLLTLGLLLGAGVARGAATDTPKSRSSAPLRMGAKPHARRGSSSRELPGALAGGRRRLANGWQLSPAGRHVLVGGFPQNLCVSPDERWAVVTQSDFGKFSLTVVDLESARNVQRIDLASTWRGVTFIGDGHRLAAAGGLTNRIYLYDFAQGRAVLADSIALGPPWSAGGQYPQGRTIDYGKGAIWPCGLAADPEGRTLYAVSRLDNALYSIDLGTRTTRRLALPATPFTCLASRDHRRIFVSLWSGSGVALIDARHLTLEKVVSVGDHPCEMVESADGRLFVTNANQNTVSVIDVATGNVEETLTSAPDPHSPSGSTPDALALDQTGRLFVANADNNCLAVLDVSRPGQSRLLGFIPTGAYPTGVCALARRKALVVANGRGMGSTPSSATMSILDQPDPRALAVMTRQVMRNTPATRSTHVARLKGPIPSRSGERSPIRHVFYVFKENRTYDDILGDVPEGNGDSSLCLFGQSVTPNHHALARQFVLLDNTYCDADGSADGHNWGMAAYSNDYVTKSMGTSPIYDYEGGNALAYPHDGYLWDLCRRHGVSYRSYGEFVFNPDSVRDTVRAGVASLEGHTAPHYRGYDTFVSDLDRYRAWLEEFDRYEREGGLPELEIIRLPNDHTEGTCRGRPTPRAHIAENDLALGLMVDRISHSKFWKESVIFVIEDDAANGPDHVDSHRTVALAIGPYVRHGAVDSRLYTSSSVLHTIELILGLPPMSQFDAAAPVMDASFTSAPDLAPFTHVESQVDLSETNLLGAYGQERSERMNFAEADAAPPEELKEILWRSARGATVALPPTVRGAFAVRFPRAPEAEREPGRTRVTAK